MKERLTTIYHDDIVVPHHTQIACYYYYIQHGEHKEKEKKLNQEGHKCKIKLSKKIGLGDVC